MSQEAKVRLSGFGLMLFFATVVGLMVWSPAESLKRGGVGALAHAASPPEIDPSLVEVFAPVSGRVVSAKLQATAITNGAGTDVRLHNLTTGEWSASFPFDPVKGATISGTGSGGDLLELEAVNSSGTDVATLGYIPEPLDVAQPEIDPSRITKAWNGSTFSLTYHASSAVDDESFPVFLELYVDGNPSGAVTDTVISKTDSFSLSISATPEARMVFRATDDFGNRTEMHYRATNVNNPPVAAGLGSFVASPHQTNSERTDVAPRAGKGVLLHGREFVFDFVLWEIAGAKNSTLFPLTYRSGIDFDGSVGLGWDFGLDSRIENLPGGERCWLTGAGRVEESFPVIVPSADWDSPAGVFQKLTYSKPQLEYTLEDRLGTKRFFSGKNDLLQRVEDAYGNTLTIIRNSDLQVVEVRDDLGRRISLSWFDTGRLAQIRDFAGRTLQVSYDKSGCLTEVRRPDGTKMTFEYTAGISGKPHLLTRVNDEAGNAAVVNEYDSAGKINFQNDLYSLDSSGKYTFLEELNGTSVIGARVIDPIGAETVYEFDPSSTHVTLDSVEQFSNLNLRGGVVAGYPGDDDPESWKVRFTYGANLLRTQQVHDALGVMVGGALVDKLNQEGESWSYESPTDPDPLLRERIKYHTQLGDFADPNDDLAVSWGYAPGERFPEVFNTLRGAAVYLEYDAAGQLCSREQPGVLRESSAVPYTIKRSYEYDSRGRLETMTGPNRWEEYPATDKPEQRFTYYSDDLAVAGLEAGQLSTVEQLDTAGVAQFTTTYHWDAVGNVLSRIDPGGAVWEWEYDLNDRVTRALEPEVTLSNQVKVQGETVWDYGADGILDAIRSRNWNADGTAGTPAWSEKRYFHDAYGRLFANEWDRDGTRVQRREFQYTPRGGIAQEAARVGVAKWAIKAYEYDERSSLLRSVVDPSYLTTPSSAPSSTAISTWYRFDLAGRELHRYAPLSTGPVVSHYDAFGRRETRETSLIDLGSAHEGDPNVSLGPLESASGYVRWETEWTAASDVAAVRRLTRADAINDWAVVSETRYRYDSAGRNTAFLEARDWNPGDPVLVPTDWAEWETDYYADGTTWKERSPGQPEEAITVLDDLGRVEEVTDQAGNRVVYSYDSSTGDLLYEDREPINELFPTTTISYRTQYHHDELGRKTGFDFYGDQFASPPPPKVGERYEYNSLGILTQASKYNATLSEHGIVTKYTVDLLGSVSNVKVGKAFASYLDYQETEYEFDELGRVSSSTHNPQAPGGSQSLPPRTRSWILDALGRVTQETLPPKQTTPGSKSYTYETNGYRLRV